MLLVANLPLEGSSTNVLCRCKGLQPVLRHPLPHTCHHPAIVCMPARPPLFVSLLDVRDHAPPHSSPKPARNQHPKPQETSKPQRNPAKILFQEDPYLPSCTAAQNSALL